MTLSRAPYMEWAKSRPRPRIDLAGSNLLACSLSDLPGAREAVDIAGESPEGYLPLREAIARRYGVTMDRVATAGGCSGANFLACAALLDPGDEVLVETPTYDPLPAAARLLGAPVRTFARRFEDGWDLDPAAVGAALTRGTRLVVVSDPHNPSGAVASRSAWDGLARLAEDWGFHVLVDQVYRDAVPGEPPPLAAELSPRFVTTSSLTKAYGLAALRCGWAIASPALAEAVRRARDIVDVWAPMPSDRLSVLAFEHMDRLAARAGAIVESNLAAANAFFARRTELACVRPRATLAFPRLLGVEDTGAFVERLYRQTGTAVAPGRFFGAPAHFRIALGGEPSAVADGLAAIESCLGGA